MKILLHENVQLQTKDILRLVRPSQPDDELPEREGGVHLSGVLQTWAMNCQILSPSEWKEEEGDLSLRMFMGLCVEWGISRLYPESEWWPGGIERDGVIGSPDGTNNGAMAIYPAECTIEEIKYTHMSCSNGRDIPNLNSRQGVVDWWRRLQQGMGYCNLHPLRPHRVRYHVLYGCGDYVRPYKERYVRTLVEFTDKELDKNWETVQKYKRLAKAERERGVKQ